MLIFIYSIYNRVPLVIFLICLLVAIAAGVGIYINNKRARRANSGRVIIENRVPAVLAFPVPVAAQPLPNYSHSNLFYGQGPNPPVYFENSHSNHPPAYPSDVQLNVHSNVNNEKPLQAPRQ